MDDDILLNRRNANSELIMLLYLINTLFGVLLSAMN